MQQEIYLKNGNKFWHCAMPDQHTIIIRFGKVIEKNQNNYEEVLEKEVVEHFDDEEETSNYLSESMHSKMLKGYTDFEQSLIKTRNNKNVNQLQQRQVSDHEDNSQQFLQKQPRKMIDPNLSISQLTDQAVNSKPKSLKKGDSEIGKAGYGPISVLLASNWEESIDPTNYLISEKLDGMRMVWTGKTMYSRNGNIINFPKFFVEGWPQAQLDGELWLERDSFQKLVSITKRKVPDEDQWRRIKYMVFDAPGLVAPFKVRYERFKSALEESNSQYLVCVPHIVCTGIDHLKDELTKVQDLKGEGLMIRDPEGHYEGRRSKVLLKVKTFEDDEATVLGHEEGSGRCAGMVGALKVRNSWGCEFHIGSGLTDEIRKKPPKIGSTITYKYWGTSKTNTPRFPIYMRIRPQE